MSVRPEVVSYVISEYMKDKMVSSNRVVVAPNPEDVSHLLECFLRYVKRDKAGVDGRFDMSDIIVE